MCGRRLLNQFENYEDLSNYISSDKEEIKKLKAWNNEIMNNIIMPIQSDLENEFRELLGVE